MHAPEVTYLQNFFHHECINWLCFLQYRCSCVKIVVTNAGKYFMFLVKFTDKKSFGKNIFPIYFT